MPRTTPRQQFERYQFIQRVFVEDRGMFADLLALDQWELFDFYKPKSDFTLKQLREYQAAMAKREPSLPQRAGKAYREFERAYAARQARAKLPQVPIVKDHRNSRTRTRSYIVRGLVRDEIDGQKLTRVLLEIAQSMEEKTRLHKMSRLDTLSKRFIIRSKIWNEENQPQPNSTHLKNRGR